MAKSKNQKILNFRISSIRKFINISTLKNTLYFSGGIILFMAGVIVYGICNQAGCLKRGIGFCAGHCGKEIDDPGAVEALAPRRPDEAGRQEV